MRMVDCLVNGKYNIKMPEHRAARDEWYSENGWERARLDSMHEHLGKGDVVYYVGAELGEMPALCQMWGAEVVLFEPNHTAWPSIKAVWDANDLTPPLAVFPGFASNKHQPDPINPDWELVKGNGYKIGSDGWPRYSKGKIILEHGFSELFQEADGLPQFRIDDVVREGLKPPTAITMDVEGSDFQVLLGAEQTIIKYKPKIWMSWHPEFQYHQYNLYTRDTRNWLIDRGYDEFYLDYQHELHMLYLPNDKPSK